MSKFRVAYVAHWEQGRESGVFKKFYTQMRAWQRGGVDSRLFVLTRNHELISKEGELHDAFLFKSEVQRLSAWRGLVKGAIDWRPSVFYLRNVPPLPFLMEMWGQGAICLELNTIKSAETRLWTKKWLNERISLPPAFRSAAGVVAVSGDILKDAKKGFPLSRGLVIGNSIELDRWMCQPTAPSDPIETVFIGSPNQRWHGLDRLLTIACRLPEWRFHVVGTKREAYPESPPNVVWHGFLPEDKYLEIFARSTFAFGALAPYRVGLTETSSLKVREYLASGLPVALGGFDTDFPGRSEFILSLSNQHDVSEADVRKLKGFASSWRAKRVDRASVSCLDSGSKEALRIGFLRELAA